MKIYFAGAIRGGRSDVQDYQKIISHLQKYGKVLTEHVGDSTIDQQGEGEESDRYIHDRDMKWLSQSDLIVAEVSTPSLGVGYEIGRAVEDNKLILCLYRTNSEYKLSAMLAGCDKMVCQRYNNITEAEKIVNKFIKSEFDNFY